jgi:hypothetical protein
MKGTRGVFLVEAILAATVLTTGIVLLLQASRASLRAGALAGDRYRASLLIESRLWDLAHAPLTRVEGPREELDPALGALRWDIAARMPEGTAAETEPSWRWWDIALSWGEPRDGKAPSLALTRALENAS